MCNIVTIAIFLKSKNPLKAMKNSSFMSNDVIIFRVVLLMKLNAKKKKKLGFFNPSTGNGGGHFDPQSFFLSIKKRLIVEKNWLV